MNYLGQSDLESQFAFELQHLTATKKYVIILTRQSGIYNIPIIPLDVTSIIFEKGKQEVIYFEDRFAVTGCFILFDYSDAHDILVVDMPDVSTTEV